MLWYFFVALSIVLFALVNITDKIVSNWNNKIISLLLRYSFSLAACFILLFFLWESFSLPATPYLLALLGVWIIAYSVNIIMYLWLKKLNTWTFFMLAYSYLVFLFFINIIIYWGNEILSVPKTIAAFAFIWFVMYMTYISGKWWNRHEFLWYVFALLCAIWWTACYWIEGYMIKYSIASPIMTMLIAYLGSITIAISVFIIKYSIIRNEPLAMDSNKIFAPALWWILIALWSWSLLFSYKYMPINIANILWVSEMLVTTVLAILVLKEKHPAKEIRKILLGFLILLVFVSVK